MYSGKRHIVFHFFQPLIFWSILWLCCSFSQAGAENLPKIVAVTEHLPPYQIQYHDHQIGGSTVEFMREVLSEAEISYDLQLMPWPRAYKLALSKPNIVIFSMVRNKDREDKFVWLGKLRTERYFLFGLKSRFSSVFNSLQEVKSFIAVATRNTYESQQIKGLGFEEGINLILTTTSEEKWAIIRKDRAQITMMAETISAQHTDFVPLWPMEANVDLWVAASKQTQPEVISRIQKTMSQQNTQRILLKIPSS